MFTDENIGRSKLGLRPTRSINSRAAQGGVEETILDAFDRLLANLPYNKITMDDLVRESEIGKSSAYLYFRNREDVMLALIDRIASRVIKSLEVIASRTTSPMQKLRDMLLSRILLRFDGIRHFVDSLPDISQHLQSEIVEKCEYHFKHEARIIAAPLKEGRDLGIFTIQEPLVMAEVIIAATNSLLPPGLSVNEQYNRRQIKKKANRIIAMLLSGIVTRESERKTKPQATVKKRR